jgi:hypothetical protein
MKWVSAADEPVMSPQGIPEFVRKLKHIGYVDREIFKEQLANLLHVMEIAMQQMPEMQDEPLRGYRDIYNVYSRIKTLHNQAFVEYTEYYPAPTAVPVTQEDLDKLQTIPQWMMDKFMPSTAPAPMRPVPAPAITPQPEEGEPITDVEIEVYKNAIRAQSPDLSDAEVDERAMVSINNMRSARLTPNQMRDYISRGAVFVSRHRWASQGGDSAMEPKDWQQLVVKAFGYTDICGQMRAAELLGAAKDAMWNKCIAEVKKEHGKEIKAAIEGLRAPWNPEVPASNKAYFDVVAKVLQAHDIYPWPSLISGILGHNPFQDRWTIPDYVGDTSKVDGR